MTVALLLLSGCGSDSVRAPDPAAASPPINAPMGQPSWFPIGPDISQPGKLADVDIQVLSLGSQPQWFLGMARTVSSSEYSTYWSRMSAGSPATRPADAQLFPAALPYPHSVQDIALRDHGATLGLDISTTSDPTELLLILNLSSPDQPLMREVEAGWTNALPFLFSIFIDGRPVTVTATSSETSGGAFGADTPYMIPLVSQGSTKNWQMHLDARSLNAMLPDTRAHSVALVAAFSNRQHEVYFIGDGPSLGSLVQPRGAKPDSQILVRSQPVQLQWTGERWLVSNAQSK